MLRREWWSCDARSRRADGAVCGDALVSIAPAASCSKEGACDTCATAASRPIYSLRGIGYNFTFAMQRRHSLPSKTERRHDRHMRVLGKTLQLLALIGLPTAIPLELAGVIRTGPMLTIMVGSIALFYLGRLVEGYSQPS